jgi:hypothetical protein
MLIMENTDTIREIAITATSSSKLKPPSHKISIPGRFREPDRQKRLRVNGTTRPLSVPVSFIRYLPRPWCSFSFGFV